MAYNKRVYGYFKSLGMTKKEADKYAHRKNGWQDMVRAQELYDVYGNDKTIIGSVLEGKGSENWDNKTINKFIRNTEKARKEFMDSSLLGMFTKEEKEILKEELKAGNIQDAVKTLETSGQEGTRIVVDRASREEHLQTIKKNPKNHKEYRRLMKDRNEKLGITAKPENPTQAGWYAIENQFVQGKGEKDALTAVKKVQNKTDFTKINISPKK